MKRPLKALAGCSTSGLASNIFICSLVELRFSGRVQIALSSEGE